jgi:hypothetical protein
MGEKELWQMGAAAAALRLHHLVRADHINVQKPYGCSGRFVNPQLAECCC